MIRITLIVLLLIGCGNITDQDKGSTYTFEFDVNNNNSSKFGRKVYDDGEVVSVTSLCKSGNIVYLVDPIHNNIKALDLKTGELTVSDKLVFEKTELTDIAVQGQRILVSTDGDIFYSLSLELSLHEVRRLNRDDGWGRRKFIRQDGNLYIFSESTDVVQDKNSFDMRINAFRVENDLNLVVDTLRLGKGYRVYEKARDGYKLTENGKCLQTSQFQLCLNEKFPEPQCSYSCRNIFADSNSVSFFEFRNNKFRVKSIEGLH